ncbi:MAG: cation:dicarboxylase symporter family transporter [Oscillospiraceae bacterium]|nr:cation:dicarboxylase symporter family transporter [Oscillospiraceae bacterium]
MITQRNEKYNFSPQAVDELSALCVEALTEAEADRKDILRVRLSIEEILESWLDRLEGREVTFKSYSRLGRQQIEICVSGDCVKDDSSDENLLFSSRLLAQSGLVPVYSYKNGGNRLSLTLTKKMRLSSTAQLVISLLLAAALGLICQALPERVSEVALAVTQPMFDALVGLLKTVASPLVLFSVCLGITGMGDIHTFSTVGSAMVKRFLLLTFVISVLSSLAALPFFAVSFGGSGVETALFGELYDMLLDILPSDIISPFLTGNALQIIFVAIFLGIALLALGTRVSSVRDVLEQLNDLTDYFMSGISKLMPLFIFLSVFGLFCSGITDELASVIKCVILYISIMLAVTVISFLWAAAKYRVSPGLLLKKMLPGTLIAFSTASFTSAMSSVLESCEKDLGIPKNITRFSVPLGQVIFKPTSQLNYFIITICVAEALGVVITPTWVIVAILSTTLIAFADPPIPGGGVGMYTIIFAQLGIPVAGLAIAVSLETLFDPFATAMKTLSLQSELVLSTGRLKLLDTEILKRSKK